MRDRKRIARRLRGELLPTGRAARAREGWGRGSGGGAQVSTHARDLPTPTPIPSPQGGGEQRAASSEIASPAPRWSPIAPARSIGRMKACSSSPICIWKKARPSPRAACCCRPMTRRRRLARLAMLIERYAPRLVIALGDSFHDGGGPARMSDISRAGLKALQRGRDWLWIAGNHDPDPADNIGGRFAETLALGPLTFRHEPSPHLRDGEIAGHLHPQARIARRGRAVSRRCFRQRRQAAGHAGLRRLCGRPQCARPRHRVIVRRAVIHRAHAERAAHLRRRRGALLGRLI